MYLVLDGIYIAVIALFYHIVTFTDLTSTVMLV